jgi:hypothetical protein
MKISIIFQVISFPNLKYFSHSISHLAIYMTIAFAKHILSHEYVYLDEFNEMRVESVLPIYENYFVVHLRACKLYCLTSLERLACVRIRLRSRFMHKI